MRYHHLSTFAGDGMTHAECRVHDEEGALLASFTVDAMVAALARGRPGRHDRTVCTSRVLALHPIDDRRPHD